MSKIEWTNRTWNPVVGCSIITEGCTNCYAMNLARRLEVGFKMPQYAGTTRKSGKRVKWTGQVNLVEKALDEPYKWRKPRMCFVNSMSDLFHEDVPFWFIKKVFKVCYENGQHKFQILTKRHERMLEFTRQYGNLPANIWLGVSVESSKHLKRINYLTLTHAKVKFVSFEPLIDTVQYGELPTVNLEGIHWAIVGGESGHGARPMKEEWVDHIHHSCKWHNVAFFFKQWGAWGADGVKRSKKANGRIYKGREWNEMPDERLI